jgi:hypothetical protein
MLVFFAPAALFFLVHFFVVWTLFRNTDKSPSRDAVLTALKLNSGKDAGLYMFHANTLENAKDIVGGQGINPKKGRKNCAFGHAGSFYLTADFDHSLEWAMIHGKGLSAVIIYSVPQIPPQIPGIDLSATDTATQQRWSNLVLHSLKGTLHREVRLADQVEWVYGPEASFSVERDLYNTNWTPHPKTHMQLALKSFTMGFIFNEAVVGMVIFPHFR